MTHGIRMYCFDDECDPQYMRLYINIEKYIEGIDGYILLMRFGSACMIIPKPVQNDLRSISPCFFLHSYKYTDVGYIQ